MKKNTKTFVWLCAALLIACISLGMIVKSFLPKDGKAESASVEQETKEESTEEASEESSEPELSERDVYVATWGERIDAYNAGYPLAGYGQTFAAAAYDYGVDPRYSPAIARVESGSGQVCAYSCNAWGWGTQSWSDWDSAIYGHVGALAANYGSTLTYNAALRYNELDPDGWYAQVESNMYQIWGSDSL